MASTTRTRNAYSAADAVAPMCSLTSAEVDDLALRANILSITGRALHGVASYCIRYMTSGSRGMPVWTSAAVMVPTNPPGTATQPILLYAHGTWFNRQNNMAAIDAGEPHATVAAIMFAAKGFVVVAPNYVGYGPDAVSDHGYYHAKQQSQDALDALLSARKHGHALGVGFDGPLFVAGYSQGGAVALATIRRIEACVDHGFDLRAGALMSGAYLIEHSVSQVFEGQSSVGANGFLPLLIGSFQNAYGDLFVHPGEVFTDRYATVLSKVPGTASYPELLQRGELPDALFDNGSGGQFLLRTEFRDAFVAERSHPLRRALCRNNPDDEWVPRTPLLLGYAARDPVAVPRNTERLFEAFRAKGCSVLLHDLEADRSSAGVAFRQACVADPGLMSYHHLAMPFCNAVAHDFFVAALGWKR